ncbi:uncharacterized protein T551_03710, partial [Pneumocystis jirovecii RU7]
SHTPQRKSTPIWHGLARAVARAVKRQTAGVKNNEVEERLFALITKEDYSDVAKCKNKIKEYCDGLKNASLTSEKVHKKLKNFCNDGKEEKKCEELKTNIEKKCNTFKDKLKTAAVKETSALKDEDCKENEQECLFLEGACSKELKDDCNTLRNKCYQKKRDKVAEDALLRAVRGGLTSEATCQGRLKEVCIELSQKSDELTKLCLYQEMSCKTFVSKKQEKCNSLEQEVKEALKKNSELRGKCLPLLEQCYFHRGNCEGDKSKCSEPTNQDCKEYIPDCDKLEEECEKQNIIYTHPGPDFNPTKAEPTVAEDIGLEELYKEAEKDGIFIGKNHLRDATALLALLIENSNDAEKKCNEVLKDKCKNSHEHEALEKLCNKTNPSDYKKKKCEELEKDIRKTCDILTSKLISNRLFDAVNSKVEWGKLPTFLSDEECAKLESYCFYFKERCPDVKEACMNVRAACYKRGLDARANKVLQENMRGMLHGSNKSWLEKFQQELVKVCKELKENKENFPNDELFVLCVQPAKAARLLTHDHQMKVIFLRQQLDQKRDFPTDKDCKELGKKCQDLGKDSKEITWPCHTLEQQCNRLGTTEILKQVLLNEHKDTLKTHENCVTYLKEKCNKWSRRGNDRFSFVCVFQNTTCKLMVDDVKDRCEVFEKNMQASDINDFLEKKQIKTESASNICPSWHPYCDRFLPNCPDLDKGKTFCQNLKKYCEPFYKRKVLEDALKVELRGKLSDENKCTTELKGYCTIAKNVNNASISGLCKDSTQGNNKKPDDKVVKELCKKLMEEIKEQCETLPAELTELEKSLEKDVKTYKELKKEAKKAMNKSNLVLSLVKKNKSNTSKNNRNNSKNKDKNAVSNGFQDITEHVKILRRGVKDVSVTELEAKAFDLAAEVFGRYVDLKERCEKLESDCGIKDDCDGLKEVCGKIEKTCRDLKPLEVKSHEIVTESTTTTTTTTTTVTDPKATECKSLQTTDTWVTQTSTHTSTSTITSTITSKITLTSTRRCKPTKCTTGDDAEDVKPSEGLKMSGWNVMRGVIVAMVISFMI